MTRLYMCALRETTGLSKARLGGTELPESARFWNDVKEHRNSFFVQSDSLWRLSVPATAASLEDYGQSALEWNGSLRWLRSNLPAENIFQLASTLSGHACCFLHQDKPLDCFQPLSPSLRQLHIKLKNAFDPQGIFNRGRLYSWC